MVHDCDENCKCIVSSGENRAEVLFDHKKFIGFGKNKEESTDIALYKMFYNYFKVTLAHWRVFWDKNLEYSLPLPDHVILRMRQEIHEYIAKRRIAILKPSEIWKTFVKTEIQEIFMRKKHYELRIVWHDKVFIATNGKIDKLQEVITRLALIHVFGINVLDWKKFDVGEKMVFEKYSTGVAVKMDYPMKNAIVLNTQPPNTVQMPIMPVNFPNNNTQIPPNWNFAPPSMPPIPPMWHNIPPIIPQPMMFSPQMRFPSVPPPIPNQNFFTGPPLFYEPLQIRVKNVLNSLTTEFLQDTYMQ